MCGEVYVGGGRWSGFLEVQDYRWAGRIGKIWTAGRPKGG